MTEYVHGTAPSEQERLAALNRLTNEAFVRFLDVRPHTRVLEVGSGLGILAADVSRAAEGVEVVGVERSEAQLAAAVRAPRVELVHGDAHRLEFDDASFDLVYARYLLEHVQDPERVLREMRRVARPGGTVAVAENDISLMRVDPPAPAFERAWAELARVQASLGGDALIGRRLYRLFRAAGFTRIELSVQPEVHWHGSPGFEGWVRNLIGNLDGVREFDVSDAVAELEALLTNPDASCLFTWNRARAER